MKWKILNTEQIANSQQQTVINKIIETLLNNRNLRTKKQQDEFLNPSLDLLNQNFFDHKQLKTALSRIKQAIGDKEQIIVYSDYDADGITGGCILWETLDACGARVMPYVPNRMEEGYGMSKKGIDAILSQFPDAKLIVTVDHGITAVEQTNYAKEKGLDVIITDHHTIGASLPGADAIVHTTLLAGSGVSFVFSQQIKQFFRHSERSEESGTSKGSFVVPPQDDNDEYLALAALGTIADLVPLIGPNRVIAKFGLEALNITKRIGLLSLIEEAGLLGRKIGTYEVGFVLAPRINASGRLTHALDALRLLCTKNPTRARELARLLNATNLDRQTLMNESNEHARTLISKEKKLLFIAHETYHEGIIGLVAGRLVEEFYRPAIVVAKGKKYSKASARSINGFNIVNAIRSCSDILVNVGGHPMAAGFTVETAYLPMLEERLLACIEEQLSDELLEKELRVDMELPFGALSLDLLKSIQQLAPFGMGNPEPVFATKNITIVDAATVGNEGQHLRLKLKSGNMIIEAIGFGLGNVYPALSSDKPINIAYSLSENTWNGNTKIQLKIKDIRSIY